MRVTARLELEVRRPATAEAGGPAACQTGDDLRAQPGGRRWRRPAAVTGPKAPTARRAPSAPPPGTAAVQLADQLQDGREDAAVDADGGAGQAPAAPAGRSRSPAHLVELEAAQLGQGRREQRQPALLQRPHQVARAQLAGGVQLVDQPPLHRLALAVAGERDGGLCRWARPACASCTDSASARVERVGSSRKRSASDWRSAWPTQM